MQQLGFRIQIIRTLGTADDHQTTTWAQYGKTFLSESDRQQFLQTFKRIKLYQAANKKAKPTLINQI